MGYNTRFELKWSPTSAWKAAPRCAHGGKAPDAKFCATCGRPNVPVALDELVGSYIEDRPESMGYALEPGGDPHETCTWYTHESDLIEMSRQIPGVLFHLSGEGEDAGDIWDAYALDGKYQEHKAEIVRGELDEKAWR